ncbi:thioesterase family protein [Labedaea rhizosphaerae]|uniref:Thioesterase superfamily protein n=1 Tax=Labedaea rhizosphaerae TaxID=598644 RepID=A0A4R6RYX7_LABRH|nr:thioesterase family protein [Labedaea rhizosphaerae]TDP92163.1 thioesterase superfamily protein [Labedaea rhizosphaerae]
MDDAFYKQLDENRFQSTEHTAGPWGPGMQHMGPPAALVMRAVEGVAGGEDRVVARLTVEILGPVPLGELTVNARLERPGRSVEMVSAELIADGRPVAVARAWRIGASDTSTVQSGLAAPLAPPSSGRLIGRPAGWGPGYLDAMEWRALAGALGEPGAATVWVRQNVALVEGEEPSPLQRLCAVADSGNGVSGMLPPTEWWFINTELTVHVQRPPVGEWICLDAVTSIGPSGVGTARSTLHDLDGQVAFGAQALMIRPRMAT